MRFEGMEVWKRSAQHGFQLSYTNILQESMIT